MLKTQGGISAYSLEKSWQRATATGRQAAHRPGVCMAGEHEASMDKLSPRKMELRDQQQRAGSHRLKPPKSFDCIQVEPNNLEKYELPDY